MTSSFTPVPLDEIRQLMLAALRLRGITGDDAEFLADDYLDAELAGKVTHGIGKFLTLDAVIESRIHEPKVERRDGGVVRVNGGREIGQIAARFAARLACDLARSNGIGIATLVNSARFGRLAPYARLIAEAGFAGLVFNNAGPAAVAPPGSAQAILGTNPICFGLPSGQDVIVIDFSTAERVWGEIRQAILDGRSLPPGAFLNAKGEPTTDPYQAEAVRPFDDHKGFALCLAIELLAGSLAGARMGLEVESEFDLGNVFIAFGLASEHAMIANADLMDSIRNSPSIDGNATVRVPGDGAAAATQRNLKVGALTLAEETLSRLVAMSQTRTGGLPPSDKLN